MPLDQRILYYNAMIKQTMMYGSSVWVSTSVDNLNKVFRLQKRAARVILNADTGVDLLATFFSSVRTSLQTFERGVSRLYARITQTKHRHTFY